MLDWFTGKVAYLSTRLGFAVGSGLAQMFPRGAFWLSDRLAAIGFALFRGYRRRSMRNIESALRSTIAEPEAARIAFQALRNFFRACVEIAAMINASDEQIKAAIALEGRENLEAALNKHRGVLILSAHMGNFFLVGTRLAVEGFPIHVLVNQPRDSQFALLMDHYRLQVRQETIHARPRREALRQLNGILRRNRLAVVIADEYRKGNGVPASFFGKTVFARRGPATVAMRTGAALVPAYMIRKSDDSLKLIIEPELELERRGKTQAEVKENTRRITAWTERTIRRYPEQWNWANIRWWQDCEEASTVEAKSVERAS